MEMSCSEDESTNVTKGSSCEEEALINKRLPKELLLQIFSFLDVVSLCRCAQVSKYWKILALDGINWQTIDLFKFQTDISSDVVKNLALACKGFLKQLSLRGCKNISDTALIIFSQTCKNIEFLNLTECRKLTDLSIEKVGTYCEKLISLNLTCVEITDASLIAISNGCTQLKYLDVSYCTKISHEGLRSISINCKKLISLKARMCTQLDDNALISIAEHCSNLETLNLQRWIELTDNSVHLLGQKCKKLTYLCLSSCNKLTDYSLISIGQNCKKLKVLEVARCSAITDNSFRELTANCPELTSLDLEECNLITDTTLLLLGTNCPLLESLILSLCEQISDTGINYLTNKTEASKNLKVLELDNCPFITDQSLEYLSKCTALERIEVYDCQGISKEKLKEFMESNATIKVHFYFSSSTPPEIEPRISRESRCCIIL